jgi:hypothetical protein
MERLRSSEADQAEGRSATSWSWGIGYREPIKLSPQLVHFLGYAFYFASRIRVRPSEHRVV